ncbi:MAG: hypothetical protein AAF389_03985 [Gemmatimonadota bacterium]
MRDARRVVLWGATLLALVAYPVAGQSTLRTALDTTLLNVGDRMVLTVQVEHPSGATVVWPDSLDLTPFEVLGAGVGRPESTGDRVRSTAAFELTTFELGELELPSFPVDVLYPDGSRETLDTDRYGVEVTTIGVDEGGDIREIRGPLMIPLSTITIALWFIVLLALLGAAAYGYRRWRANRSPAEDAHTTPTRPAHEIALEGLRDVQASNMLQRGQVKEYHIEVSEVLRRYVEARYHVTALEMTTWEIIEGLRRVGVGDDFRDGLRRLLDACDMVKFAKVRPDRARSEHVVTSAIELVEASVSWLPGHAGDADHDDQAAPAGTGDHDDASASREAAGSEVGA